MAQYLLSVMHGGPMVADEEKETDTMFADVGAFNAEVQASGNWVFAGGLAAVDTATVVDATGDTVQLTDGPYVETKEHVGGFWVFTADDLDGALDLARRGSAACGRPVEVRAFAD